MNKTVFLDRDGTIIRDVHYCADPRDVRFLPGAVEGIRHLNETGFKVILITNQSGIARGYFNTETLYKIHEKIQADLRLGGAHIDGIYFCPHHPDEHCDCRKPNTALVEKAVRDWQVDISASYFIGDKFLDMETANRTGCKAILVPSSEPELGELRGHDGFKGTLDFVSAEFGPAVDWIVGNSLKADDLSIIIPTLNEEQNLPHVIPLLPLAAEVIMVDGHSDDRSIEIARELRPDIIVLTQPRRGKGDAIRQGFGYANRDIIVTFDADGSFCPGEIGRFANPLRNGYDLVKGSRFLAGGATMDMTTLRRLGNRLFTILTNVLFGTRYTDLAYGFHAFRRTILEDINLKSDGFEIDTELFIKAKKARLRVKEVPSMESFRLSGQGKLETVPDGLRILKTIMRERFNG